MLSSALTRQQGAIAAATVRSETLANGSAPSAVGFVRVEIGFAAVRHVTIAVSLVRFTRGRADAFNSTGNFARVRCGRGADFSACPAIVYRSKRFFAAVFCVLVAVTETGATVDDRAHTRCARPRRVSRRTCASAGAAVFVIFERALATVLRVLVAVVGTGFTRV